MPRLESRRWHHDSTFGDGPRLPLDRDQRARFKFLLNAHRRARRLTPLGEHVGRRLLKHLATSGRCDPCHDTLAEGAGCSTRTVQRATKRLQQLGLLTWQRRLVRDGWAVAQTSNAYRLDASGANAPAFVPVFSTKRQNGDETRPIDKSMSLSSELERDRRNAAQQLLALGHPIPAAWGV